MTEARVSGEELVERARALRPALRERSAQTETDRRVPDETAAAFHRAGLWRTLKPRAYGGHELTTAEHIEITFELASACGASGWVFSLLCEHSWIISMFPKETQDEIWGATPDYVASASLHPEQGSARRVPGGFRVNGRYSFSSGCDHADYIVLVVNVDAPETENGVEPYMMLLPRQDISIDDDWFVIGLRGTGSKTIVCDEVFVPEHRAQPNADIIDARGPGLALHPNHTQLRVPRGAIAGLSVSSAVAGIGQGGVDTFVELARGHRRRFGSLADSGAIQMKLAESATEVLAAKLLIRNCAAEALATVRRGETISAELMARLQRDASFGGQLCVRAVDRLHVSYGSRGIFDASPLNRIFRDIHAAIAQSSQNWDFRGPPHARMMLGVEERDS